MLVRLSVPGRNAHAGPKLRPAYGDQLNEVGISGAPAKAAPACGGGEQAERRADGEIRTTGRNHLSGTVSRIHEGPVTVEVAVAHESVARLTLEVGKPCCALLDASSIVLASFA
jgi:molybdopterin-binding protein